MTTPPPPDRAQSNESVPQPSNQEVRDFGCLLGNFGIIQHDAHEDPEGYDNYRIFEGLRKALATLKARHAPPVSQRATGEWTQTPPTLQGEYWHWNGDQDSAPLPMFVLWSGHTKKCFVSMGQLGITQAVDCDEYGGWWMPLYAPPLLRATPRSLPNGPGVASDSTLTALAVSAADYCLPRADPDRDYVITRLTQRFRAILSSAVDGGKGASSLQS